MRRSILVLAGIILAIGAMTPAMAQREAAMTLIVNGIAGPPTNPSAPMDVLIDGSMCLGAIEFGQVLGPFPFEARPYTFTMGPASPAEPCSVRPVALTTVSFVPGEISSIALFTNVTNRSLRLEKFTVTHAGPTAGDGIVSLHHTAAAPPLDFLLETAFDDDGDDDDDDDGDDDDDDDDSSIMWAAGVSPDIAAGGIAGSSMMNGEHLLVTVAPGMYSTSVAPAGASVRMVDPLMVEVRPDALKSIFVIGSMGIRGLRVIEHDWNSNQFQGVVLYDQIRRD